MTGCKTICAEDDVILKSEGRNPTRCDGATARREEARNPKPEKLRSVEIPDWVLAPKVIFSIAGKRPCLDLADGFGRSVNGV